MKNKNYTSDRKRPETGPGPAKIERFGNTEIDDIIVKSSEGKYITKTEIQNSIDRYIKSLYNPDDIFNNKPMIFNGLLEYIYRHNIKPIIPNTYNYDWQLLDNVFENIYINLCYTFSYIPMVTIFTNHLVHIDIKYIYNIKDGIRVMDDNKVNPNIVRYIQKWISICNGDLFTHIAQTNSIGSIFIAKVKGFSDQPQQISVNINADVPKLDLKQIASIGQTGIIETPNK
jgi:hypothetical protein